MLEGCKVRTVVSHRALASTPVHVEWGLLVQHAVSLAVAVSVNHYGLVCIHLFSLTSCCSSAQVLSVPTIAPQRQSNSFSTKVCTA